MEGSKKVRDGSTGKTDKLVIDTISQKLNDRLIDIIMRYAGMWHDSQLTFSY